MSKVENAVIWFTDDFSSRIGVRLWDEIGGHLEIVYEEFDSIQGAWKEVSSVNAIDTETFTKLTEAGKFLLEMQTKDSK